MKFLGFPYPVVRHPNGLLHTQSGVDQIKSDLLVLLLTNPGERVMLPSFGTPLRELMFEPNDAVLEQKARDAIIQAVATWEPRVVVEQISVAVGGGGIQFNPSDDKQAANHVLGIQVRFFDPENLQEVDELRLEVPIAGA